MGTDDRRVKRTAVITCPSCGRRIPTARRHCDAYGCTWTTCPRCLALVEVVTRRFRRRRLTEDGQP